MKGRWRQLAARPIRDRRRTFAVCVAILAAAAVLLFSLPDRGPAPMPPPAPPSPGPLVDGGNGGESTRPASPPELAARRFVTDYLAWVYGRGGSPATLRAASPELTARLRNDQLRIPPAARARRPEIVGIDSHPIRAEQLFSVTASIGDGSVTYAIDLTVARDRRGRWRVIDVGAE
jgi:hypothetical protein